MNQIRGVTAPGARSWSRWLVLALLAALIVPVMVLWGSSAATADGDDEQSENYSLYQLASNASAYFSNANSPSNADGMGSGISENWKEITMWPAAAGSLLGYTDPDFSISTEWLNAKLSGSSGTISYESLAARDEAGNAVGDFNGMLDYVYFGAALNNLGLDNMVSGGLGGMMNVISGSLMWLLYGLAVVIGGLFTGILMILKLINPFLWFYEAIKGVSQTWADGMVGGNGGVGVYLEGMTKFISEWYTLLTDLAWQVLVPLFVAFVIFGMLFFKKMNKGSAIKKLVVRVVFIGLGVPLLGSMYTATLDKFTSDGINNPGATRVVLSTFVDFETWMMEDRLAIPAEASITWSPRTGEALPTSVMSVRNTALAINKQSHSSAYSGITVGDRSSNAKDAWSSNNTQLTGESDGGLFSSEITTTIGMLNRFIDGSALAASDFESVMKSEITKLSTEQVPQELKMAWFVGDGGGYGDAREFGESVDEGGELLPRHHPMISVGGASPMIAGDGNYTGLRSSVDVDRDDTFKSARTFTSGGFNLGNGGKVWDSGNDNDGPGAGRPMPANLSPLSAYNYLNTSFGANAMVMYSSEKATSGFTRETHASVSQVGTGPTGFMYYLNAVVLLACIVILGLWYALGLLIGSIKRMFGVVTSIPFATLGAMAAISKVIIYSFALILEIIVTLFIYRFASEFLISLPQIISDPLLAFITDMGLTISGAAGIVVTIIATVFSTLLVLAVTIGLLGVRKSVLKAIDEVVTKLIDKFLDTNTAPSQGGALPALAKGIGAGAGMAAGNKLGSAVGNKLSGGKNSGGTPGATSASGTSSTGGGPGGSEGQLAGGKTAVGALERGHDGGDSDGDGPKEITGGPNGPDGQGGPGSAAIESGSSTTTRTGSRSSDEKAAARDIVSQGGLSKLGYTDSEGRPLPQASGVAPALSSAGGVPAEVGKMPTRAETVSRLGGAKKVASLAKAEGLTSDQYLAKRGPFLDDVNPRAAAAVNAAGGSAAYLAKTGQTVASGGKNLTSGQAASVGVPAGPGGLPTRKEALAHPQLQKWAAGKGMSPEAYAQRYMGPFLDDVNPTAAKAVDAAGGTKAYFAKGGSPTLGQDAHQSMTPVSHGAAPSSTHPDQTRWAAQPQTHAEAVTRQAMAGAYADLRADHAAAKAPVQQPSTVLPAPPVRPTTHRGAPTALPAQGAPKPAGRSVQAPIPQAPAVSRPVQGVPAPQVPVVGAPQPRSAAPVRGAAPAAPVAGAPVPAQQVRRQVPGQVVSRPAQAPAPRTVAPQGSVPQAPVAPQAQRPAVSGQQVQAPRVAPQGTRVASSTPRVVPSAQAPAPVAPQAAPPVVSVPGTSSAAPRAAAPAQAPVVVTRTRKNGGAAAPRPSAQAPKVVTVPAPTSSSQTKKPTVAQPSVVEVEVPEETPKAPVSRREARRDAKRKARQDKGQKKHQ